MSELSKPKYDECRRWIKKSRDNNKDWNEIRLGLCSSEKELQKFLDNFKVSYYWPDLSVEEWYLIVDSEEMAEKRQMELKTKEVKAILIDGTQDNEVCIPASDHSSWQLYRTHLIESGFSIESIDEIERSTISILRRLSSDTTNSQPVKGLVIGHVQSGKTANIAALMAMAADWNYNFFIVLSGTIENLRKQTQTRLLNDLNRPGNITWTGLERLSKGSNLVDKLQELRLEDGSNIRYFTVTLKNSTRLRNLINWMQEDLNKYRQLKVIVIDDEADQASINTADIDKDERTMINKLIVNLVEGNKPNGEKMNDKVKAMNYISYTATPYSNFLNESSMDSLYPSNFIFALEPSNEFIGPLQIFGDDSQENCEGLDIIRFIETSEVEQVKKLGSWRNQLYPNGLVDSICWFLCCVSVMRLWNYTKPISMLIHTSQKQGHHDLMANWVTEWLSNRSNSEIISKCKEVWEAETRIFTKKIFREKFWNYGRDDSLINDYPQFDDISSGIELLISDITHIHLNEEGNLEYTPYIHLCIDNCSNNGLNEEGSYVRLAYPDTKMDNYPSPAPAFIVIGGNTLSRGLTIEGLVSTYFLRASAQADSLMQMGRWFGYRRGYELLPRIWMSAETYEKFKFLALLESELRSDLYRFMVAGAKPSEYGPRVKNSPKVSWLRITAKNKMQNAIETDIDFTGTSSQLILYENDYDKLNQNILITDEFLKKLGVPEISHLETAYVWRNIPYEIICNEFLNKFNFHPRASLFNNLDSFTEWVEKLHEDGNLNEWNVIVAGVGEAGELTDFSWDFQVGRVGKVNRSKMKNSGTDERLINIGALRGPKDLIADLDIEYLDDDSIDRINGKTLRMSEVDDLREKSGLSKTPQMIIYRVRKDSVAREEKESSLREDLKAIEDLIGICIMIPGERKNGIKAQSLTVLIKNEIFPDGLED